MSTQKIFGIGMNKTGTTTLDTCFKILGSKHVSWSPELLEDIKIKKCFPYHAENAE